uniref:Transposase (Putative), gypsy type n=1 Tax=Tanacetum cinerariifolium TaxID=118510 RepID=A0A699H8Y9_TANCI|nr:hypothetical protein [Tanacetum cinerariifolium]
MDLFAFIHTPDPTKVRVVERERDANEPRLLDTTVGRTVSMLPIAPDRADSELDASVERLFGEGGSGNQTEQGDSARGVPDADIQPVVEVSHPSKKLRGDHGTPCVTSVGGKSIYVVKRLLVGAVLNAEVRVAAILSLPFVTSSVTATQERANVVEAEVDSVVRSFVPVMTAVTTTTPTAGPTFVIKEKVVYPSMFGDGSSFASGINPIIGSVTNGSRLDDGRVCREMVNEFAHPKFFPSVRRMKHDQLFTEFNVGAALQMSLSAKVRMRAEYNIQEKRGLKSVVDEQAELLKVREKEIENLKAQLSLREVKAAEVVRLRAQASELETVEKSLWDETNVLKERNAILEKERDALDMKVTELETSDADKERELTDLNALVHELEVSSFGLQEKVTAYENCMEQLEKFQDDQMKIMNDKWLLTYGMELAIAKFLNSSKYLSALGAAIGKAIEKGMQDGLAAGITHGKKGRILTDVDTYNHSAKVDYVSALQQLQSVNFPFLSELRSHKDASVEAVMDILRLEDPVAEKIGLNELQPHVDQLMVPIHHSPCQVVVGATALSLSLDTSKGTSDGALASAVITDLSTTLVSTSVIEPISIDDYEVVDADDQAVAGENVASFPNVDDAELRIS